MIVDFDNLVVGGVVIPLDSIQEMTLRPRMLSIFPPDRTPLHFFVNDVQETASVIWWFKARRRARL